MQIRNKLLDILPVSCGCVFYLMAIHLHKISTKPLVNVGKQETAYNLNKNFLKLISLGNKRMISNIIWIQTLLESDQEKFYKRNYTNWMYLRFLSVATLDPLFYENYLYGGMYLSVVKDDLYGAANIFGLGLKKYPDDYRLNYYSGFNYFFELGDYQKGYENLKKIADHPETPTSVKMVINKLRFETTRDYETSISFLKHTLSITKDDFVKKKIINDIYSLVAQRDLGCLNEKKANCNKFDATGEPYIQIEPGVWSAKKKFYKYQINRPQNKK